MCMVLGCPPDCPVCVRQGCQPGVPIYMYANPAEDAKRRYRITLGGNQRDSQGNVLFADDGKTRSLERDLKEKGWIKLARVDSRADHQSNVFMKLFEEKVTEEELDLIVEAFEEEIEEVTVAVMVRLDCLYRL